MFCTQCGAQIPDNAKFCTSCGTRIQMQAPTIPAPTQAAPPTEPISAPQYQQAPSNYENTPVPEEKPKKKKTGLIIGIIAGVAILAAIALVLIFVVFKKESVPEVTVDLTKYVQVTFTGYNGQGEADVTLNLAQIHADYDDQLVWTVKEKYQPEESVTDLLCENIEAYLDKYYYLSNGDAVTVMFNEWFSDYNELLPDYYGNNAVITCETMTFIVDTLQEPTAFDPFEGAVFTLEGYEYDTLASMTLRDDLEAMNYLFITTDADLYSLKNGDVVTYYIYGYTDADKDTMIELYGMYPSVTEWSYTVEGLDHYGYITDVEETVAFRNDLATAFETDVKENYSADDFKDNGIALISTEKLGYYYWTLTPGQEDIDTNVLYLVYKVTLQVTKEDKTTEDLVYYTFARVTDLYLEKDGRITCYEGSASDYYVPNNTIEFTWDDIVLTCYGYETLVDDLAFVKAEADHFTFVSDME